MSKISANNNINNDYINELIKKYENQKKYKIFYNFDNCEYYFNYNNNITIDVE